MFLVMASQLTGIITAYIVIIFLIGGIVLYFTWQFIKFAVKSGVKDAIKETLIDTGIIADLVNKNTVDEEN